MTTPVPTTAAAHRAMVEALRAIDQHSPVRNGKCSCGAPVDVCLASKNALAGCLARRALEGREKRPRLRDQQELRDVLSGVFGHDNRGMPTARIDDALDAIEAALFGAGREAPAYGVLMCSECGCSSDSAKACNRDCPCHRTGPRTGGEQG